jgi:S1-C subfamily serine protease
MKASLAALALALTFAGCAREEQQTAGPAIPSEGAAPGALSGVRTIPRPPAASLGFALSHHDDGRPVVVGVDEGTPAEQAGMAVGDIILSIDGHDTRDRGTGFRGATPGRRFVLRVQRDTTEREIVLVAGPPRARSR